MAIPPLYNFLLLMCTKLYPGIIQVFVIVAHLQLHFYQRRTNMTCFHELCRTISRLRRVSLTVSYGNKYMRFDVLLSSFDAYG